MGRRGMDTKILPHTNLHTRHACSAHLNGVVERFAVLVQVLGLDGAQIELASAHHDPDQSLIVGAGSLHGVVQGVRVVLDLILGHRHWRTEKMYRMRWGERVVRGRSLGGEKTCRAKERGAMFL